MGQVKKKRENGVNEAETQTYDEYKNIYSDDMEWFYGSYNSGQPYWTHKYEWDDGEIMISYTEPVIIDGGKVGVVGVDVPICNIIHLVQHFEIYDTGFALLKDSHNEFYQTSDFIKNLGLYHKNILINTTRSNSDNIFEIELNGVNYMAAQASLINDYDFYLLVPKKEFNAEATTVIRSFFITFIIALPIVLVISYSGLTFYSRQKQFLK